MREYQKMVIKMMEEHKELFDNFPDIHREYMLNPKEWQKLFNQYGREVVEIIRDYERRLCSNMATGKYGLFSQNLSEKFWGLVRKTFPKIDFVGVIQSS
jgi:UDP-galactopyranose mutase